MKSKNLKEKIIKDYDKIVKYVIKDMKLGHRFDEIYDIGLIGFVNGINNYDESKGYTYMTFLYDCIKNEIGHFLEYEKRNKRNGTTISLNTIINDDIELQELIPTYQDYDRNIYIEEIENVINRRLSNLTERDEEIFKYLYGIDGHIKMDFAELEKKFKMTKQNIQRIRNRILNMLKYEIKDYYKTYQELISNKNRYN